MPYQPPLYGAGAANELPYPFHLGKPTCLSGDIIGEYSFRVPLQEGDLLLFGDMAIYTTCKNNTFNGMPLPSIFAMRADNDLQCLKKFEYSDFKSRLGG